MPCAARRSGVIRLLLDNGVRLAAFARIRAALHRLGRTPRRAGVAVTSGVGKRDSGKEGGAPARSRRGRSACLPGDRLKVYLRNHGARATILIDAVFALAWPG